MIKFFDTYDYSASKVLDKLKLRDVFAGGNTPYARTIKKPAKDKSLDN